jgi:hypothetical protein
LLTTLDLSTANPFGTSSQLTDRALYALAALTDMQDLNLEGLGQLTDAAIGFLVRAMPRLTRLNLSTTIFDRSCLLCEI